MIPYEGQIDNWINDVNLYDVTDSVVGGIEGTANTPLKNLADRTAWLKAQIGVFNRLEDEIILTGSAPIPGTLAGHLIVAYATGIVALTLENAATFPHGAIVPITAYCTPGAVVNVQTTGQNFYDPVSGVSTVINMHHKESLLLVALTDHWKVWNAQGNFYCVGEEIKARKVLLNTLAFTGQLVNRNQYPRLTKYVLDELINGQEVTNEATWLSNPVTYRSLFSYGDGATTIRLPDERGMFERMLDLGRGVDIGRSHNYNGGYEADELKSHSHGLPALPEERNDVDRGGGSSSFSLDNKITNKVTLATGGLETRPKNIAKLNLIKF